jgi:hypothetical protein
VGGTVANGHGPVNVAHGNDFSLQASHFGHRVGGSGKRVDAVERGACADHVVVVRGAEKDAWRVGEARRHRRQAPAPLLETQALRLVHRVLGLVGAGEVADEQGGCEAVKPFRLGRQRLGLDRRKPQPAHAGVHLHHRPQPGARGARLRRPTLDRFEVVEHRHQGVGGKRGLGAGEVAVEHIDARLGERAPERHRLGEGGDEEVAAAGGGELGRHLRGAEAVGVGLDHRGRRHPLADRGDDRAPIAPDRREVDD